MRDECDFSNAERGKFYRTDTMVDKLHAEVEAAWRHVEEGKVSDFDPEAAKRRGRAKLARALRRRHRVD